ncbi:MAG: AAA family ATPase [Betaproteobacteria bacterium]|nr:AAA family ATPase [Betaproteobacteria bacterium]
MIRRVRVRNFKRFREQVFELQDSIVLAGPNNSGKTTLLQAIGIWNLALRKWADIHRSGRGLRRKGIPITRKDFTAVPLREMSLLWTDTSTALSKGEAENVGHKQGHPRPLEIRVEGIAPDKTEWGLSFEFHYQNSETISVRPASDDRDSVKVADSQVTVVHVPPFSGIGAEETQYKREYQDLLIGQGKPGDIVRNLLAEVYADEKHWQTLCGQIEEIFSYKLMPPQSEGRPFILCEYLPKVPQGRGKNGLPSLDIASAGSGFHQVLMLLAFFYARSSSVLLLDEPDAHLHVILQDQIYSRLRSIASERNCQLIIATHSEVIIDGTSPDRILSFLGSPHQLVADVERDQVREALKRLTAMDLLLVDQARGVLYLEGETDFSLLRAWAKVVGHRTCRWFLENPFWHDNRGSHPREARGHFFALRAVRSNVKGCLLLDGDNRSLPDRELVAEDLRIIRWRRYEVESYLIHSDALLRFVEERCLPIFMPLARQFLIDQLPPAVFRNPLGEHDYLNVAAASKVLLPGFFKAASLDLPKTDYFRVAEQMRPEEISGEVITVLDNIGDHLGL